jgi:hypothetical protein
MRFNYVLHNLAALRNAENENPFGFDMGLTWFDGYIRVLFQFSDTVQIVTTIVGCDLGLHPQSAIYKIPRGVSSEIPALGDAVKALVTMRSWQVCALNDLNKQLMTATTEKLMLSTNRIDQFELVQLAKKKSSSNCVSCFWVD